uniref:WGS project CBMG000000000 data, contig CS5907-c001134 n=1 Tax=Fusarium acuminatum CS5907 TaxID=1318461 RepID=A0A096PEL5_9HYPO|nr:unnamed protein product [Fusarium acuminatum CS5907]
MNSPSIISRAVVAYPRSGPFADQLVAVLQLDGTSSNACVIKSRRLGPFHILGSSQIDLMLRSRLPGYMVPSLFLSIEQIPLTGSGKSDRKKIHDHLCSLPSQVRFTSYGAPDISPLSADDTVAIAISAFLADLLDSSIIQNQDVLLDRLGISSIQAIKLLSWLKSNYGGNLSIEHLSREGMSIRTLANTVQLAASGTLIPAVDLAGEVREFTESILFDLRQNSCSTPVYRESPAGSHSTVLLTGATGYLGIEILRQLLEQPTVSLVHVLIQASSQEAGLKRLLQALSAAGHVWESAWEGRVVVWPGDLSQPQLGLQNRHWEQLTNGTINTIIHNGALVRYDLCYDKLKAVNVLATVDILQVMNSSSCAINFVYISGGQRLNPAQELSEALRISQAAKSTGYSQSKLVSELIVSRVADEFRKVRGHRLRVIRPGYIIGSPTKGLANTRDYIWRLVAGAVDAGIRSSGHDDEWMFVCDVEQVAQRIVSSSGILFPSTKPTQDNHVTTIMDGIYLRDLWELLCQELQCHLDPLNSSEWWSRLRNVVEQQGDGHPLWPLHFLLDQDQGAFTCDWKSITSDDNRFLVKKAIQKNISYLKQTGFLLRT